MHNIRWIRTYKEGSILKCLLVWVLSAGLSFHGFGGVEEEDGVEDSAGLYYPTLCLCFNLTDTVMATVSTLTMDMDTHTIRR